MAWTKTLVDYERALKEAIAAHESRLNTFALQKIEADQVEVRKLVKLCKARNYHDGLVFHSLKSRFGKDAAKYHKFAGRLLVGLES